MNLESFLMMRHELVLTAVTLILLIAELSFGDNSKHKIIPLAIILFGINMVVGFLPIHYGKLFGGMYFINSTTWVMKNILNSGVFVILLQGFQNDSNIYSNWFGNCSWIGIRDCF